MKTVQAGAHYTTITVDTAEAVKFSFPSTSLSVEASGGDITVALTDTAQAGDDETITVPDGESRMFIHHRMNIDTYYLTGSGTAKLYASNMGDVNPFKAGKRGGDAGGDNTHYKGTTTTPLANGSTTNPIVIDGESYTAVFGDVVVYGYTEFVFDGAQWSEFGRPFDTTPTAGSTNAVVSDGIYAALSGKQDALIFDNYPTSGSSNPVKSSGLYSVAHKGSGARSVVLGSESAYAGGDYGIASGYRSYARGKYSVCGGADCNVAAAALYGIAFGHNCRTTESYGVAIGTDINADQTNLTAFGKYNSPRTGDLFNIGNGTADADRSNIVEVNSTSANVNGDIQINGVNIPTPYTTMPTITESMLGKIAMYVGATGGGFTQGCFYVASTDGAAEPTYSWVRIGGGRTETVLWENTGTTNPETITLSEAWSNFDELAIITDYQDAHYINTNIKLTSTFIVGEKAVFWYYDDNVASDYFVTSSTTFTYADGSGRYFLSKIIGIKY